MIFFLSPPTVSKRERENILILYRTIRIIYVVKPTDRVKKYQLKPADIFIPFEIYLSIMESEEIAKRLEGVEL